MLGLLAPACGGSTPTTIEPDAFTASACKSDTLAASTKARIRGLKVIDDETGLEGLRCVAWQRVSPAEVKLDLFNFDAGCASDWTGAGSVAPDGTLALNVDTCQLSKCGTCLYDWSFDVHAQVAAAQPVALKLTLSTCGEQQADATTTAVIGPEPSGIRCALASYGAVNWLASAMKTCGSAGMPCVGSLLCGSGAFSSTGTCTQGLVCDNGGTPDQPVCLHPCTTVADCPRADVYACQAGLCRPTGLAP